MSPGYCRKVSWQMLFRGHRSEDVWPISDLCDGYLRLYSTPAALSVLSQLPLSRSTGCCCFSYRSHYRFSFGYRSRFRSYFSFRSQFSVLVFVMIIVIY